MPARPTVPKVIQAIFKGTIGGDTDVVNRLYFQYSGTLNQADCQTVANTMAVAWGAHAIVPLSNNYVEQSCQLTDLSSASSPQAVGLNNSSGGSASAALPAGVCVVVEFKITRRYRGGKPRVYLSGPSSGNMASPQSWSAAYLNTMLTDWNAFIAAAVLSPPAAVGTLTHVNVSFIQGFHNVTSSSGRTRPQGTLRGTPIVDIITGYQINPKAASQRRRNLQGQ